jgi:RHS repeat-associated protein
LRETWRVSEGGVETTRAVSWTYDALGQVGSLTVEGGPTLPLTYDADGLATNVGGLVIARDRLAGTEQGTTLTAGSGTVTTTQRYDEYGQVYARGSSYGAASGTGLSFAYEYDEFGRLRHVTESGEGADEARWYTYDSAGRLARVCATDTCLDAMGATTEREAYAYDANGHRTGWTNGAETGTSTTVDAQDRLLSQTTSAGTVTFTYDAAGRLETRTGPSGTSALGWDAFGALTSWTQTSGGVPVSSVEYRQDALGRRIARVVSGTVTARWVYSGIHPVGEYDASWGLKRVFVYATRTHVPDVVLANASGTWVPYRVVTDHLGSVRRVVRVSDGEVVQRMRYDSYGRVLQDEAASGWERVPFGYAGGLYDRVTGLVRFGAREYDASVGRWLSKDPIGFDGGDRNVYAYVGNTPSMHVDPNGLSWDIHDLASVIPGVNLFAAGARERAQGIFEMGNEATVDRGACRMQRGAAMVGLGAEAAGMFAMMAVGVVGAAIGGGGSVAGIRGGGANTARTQVRVFDYVHHMGIEVESGGRTIAAHLIKSQRLATIEVRASASEFVGVSSSRAFQVYAVDLPKADAAFGALNYLRLIAVDGRVPNGVFQIGFNSCATFVRDVLRIGGMNVPEGFVRLPALRDAILHGQI